MLLALFTIYSVPKHTIPIIAVALDRSEQSWHVLQSLKWLPHHKVIILPSCLTTPSCSGARQLQRGPDVLPRSL